VRSANATAGFHAVKALPEGMAASIRMASVPPHLRTLFANLPSAMSFEASVVPTAIPTTVRQLIKLATSGGGCRLESVAVVEHAAQMQVVVLRGTRRHTLQGAVLEADITAAVRELLVALFRPEELPELLEELASQTSTMATLQSVTRHMLQATDIDRALAIMMSGVTAGYSLGFNRAMLFSYDHQTRTAAGVRAVGPDSDAEAHAVWERIESEDKTFEDLIRDHDALAHEGALQQRVRRMSMVLPEAAGDDELVTAMHAEAPLLLRRAVPVNPLLAELKCSGEIVVAPLRAARRTMGILVADNRYSALPVTKTRLRLLQLFGDQAALVWENLELVKELESLARFDVLTGVLTRREFDIRCKDELARSARHGHTCGLLIIDVDRFKELNDTRGHEAGDVALRALGEVLRETLRETDLVGRYGGDEFVVCLPDVQAPDIRHAAERLGRASRLRGLSLSMGGAHFPRDCQDPAKLITLADAQLYRAKREGRGRACLSDALDAVVY